MTTTLDIQHSHMEKFQLLLRDLFQFDCADLDFGIYRIMNHKRAVINSFIDNTLEGAISQALETGRLAVQQRTQEKLEEVRQQLIDLASQLGVEAFDADGSLSGAFHDAPIGQEYLHAQEAAEGSRGSDAVEVSIYNHLYTFFSRYYQDGDFISKRRYSRSQRYAIPYNGEEVYLHWANSDQYYVKTDEHFKNYDWNAPNGVAVHFRVQDANVEQNNVNGDRRFFLPVVESVSWDGDTRSIDIPFEYRPLTDFEKRAYGGRNQQKNIIAAATSEIPECIGSAAPDAVSALAGEHRRDGRDESVSRLKHHLRQYTRRNDSDFFIHKDLRGFLLRELDFYLKNEVINLDEISAAGEVAAKGWFQQMGLMKNVGGKIIDFLAQIEDFQKMLWEKKKFVVDTQYCVTLDNVPAELHAEIVENDGQWHEWRALIDIDEDDRCAEFLQSHPTLMLDTQHFDTCFTDRLLATFDDLDDLTDGLLIHSENWQALNLVRATYRGSVNCVYIDPPYNAKSSEILYKNNYRDSSWLSIMENRLTRGRPLEIEQAVVVIAIDEVEQEYLGSLLNSVFPDKAKTCVTVVHNATGQQGNNFSSTHEYAYFLHPSDGKSIGLQEREDNPDIRPLRDVSRGSHLREDAANCFYPILVLEGEILGFGAVCPDDFHPQGINAVRDDGVVEVYPIDPSGVERKWVFARQSVERIRDELFAREEIESGQWDIIRRKTHFNYKTVWTGKRYSANSWGSRVLNNILERDKFPYPKSIYTVRDCIDAALNNEPSGTILDYFAGSGTTAHAVINLNREDGGGRKFILVEMGDYFDTVLLPRIKKVVFTPEWKNGKPERIATSEEAERSPRIVKYMRLESYEDALDCIEFDANTEQMRLEEKIEDYLIKYMLEWETRQSATLLNADKLTRPFSYKLRSHANGETRELMADVAETFNYLLGLNVRTRRVYSDDRRRYLVFRGETREAPGKEVTVIWRDTADWTDGDYERDRDFVINRKLMDGADTTYVNGTSCIPGARELEPLFNARMFAPVMA